MVSELWRSFDRGGRCLKQVDVLECKIVDVEERLEDEEESEG